MTALIKMGLAQNESCVVWDYVYNFIGMIILWNHSSKALAMVQAIVAINCMVFQHSASASDC